MIDRFVGRITGVGSTSGLRFVVGDWEQSPLGTFTDVMVATADDHRILLAPNSAVAQYVCETYSFDDVIITAVDFTANGELDAGPLVARVGFGGRTGTGRLLRAVPKPLATSRALAVLADPIARRVHPGVRTFGTAGKGRREFYSAVDQHAVVSLDGAWNGEPMGRLRDVDPPVTFGFSSTPRVPSVTSVQTTIVRKA